MASNLPDYVASAKPVPQANRVSWFSSTAPTYAGIMLWFVFWQDVPVGSGITSALGQYSEFAGGILSHGLVVAFLGLIIAALLCHFLFYLVPGLLGLKTGLPLYIVGTSTYGVQGGFLMPGFLMGVLQFGWLGVNAFFAGLLLCAPFGYGPLTLPHAVVSTVWAVAAAFMGLKGIQYVARVASFFPAIPLAILLVLFLASVGGLGSFNTDDLVSEGEQKVVQAKVTEVVQQRVPDAAPLKVATDAATNVTTATYPAQWVEVEKSQAFITKPALATWAVIALICTYIVGFFATAGAAGTDFGMNNRDTRDVQLGGLVGIAGATIFAGGLALLVVAGAQGKAARDAAAEIHPVVLDAAEKTANEETYGLAVAEVLTAAKKAADAKAADKPFSEADLAAVVAAAKKAAAKKDDKVDRAVVKAVLLAARGAAEKEAASRLPVPREENAEVDPAELVAVLIAARRNAEDDSFVVLQEVLVGVAQGAGKAKAEAEVPPAALDAAKEAAGDKLDAAVLPAVLGAAEKAKTGKLDPTVLRATNMMGSLLGGKLADIFMWLLAIAAFPPACFSAFIAANSFKTTLPKVNPFISVGIGTAVAAILAVTGLAGDVIGMFTLIGASFGPVCGAMAADYLLSGRKWAGPRAGFNLAGWISWIVGFLVGANLIPGLNVSAWCPPMLAFIVGFVLYVVLAKAGLESETLEMPDAGGEEATA